MEYDREILVQVLIYHQRAELKISSPCLCGWAVAGESHADHAADVYELELAHKLEKQPKQTHLLDLKPCEHKVAKGDITTYGVGWEVWVKIEGMCELCNKNVVLHHPVPPEE